MFGPNKMDKTPINLGVLGVGVGVRCSVYMPDYQ